MIEVINPGLSTTIQDQGRFGYRAFGVSQAGPLDPFAYHLACRLVGQPPKIPVIETFMAGIHLRFDVSACLGIGGACSEIQINGESRDCCSTIFLEKGDELKLTKIKRGWVTYLAIAGLQADQVLGSRSTSLPIKMGGYNGRSLQKGDRLLHENKPRCKPWRIPDNLEDFSLGDHIRIMKGPEFNYLDEKSKSEILTSTFTISNDSNRIGLRLQGKSLNATSYDIISRPVFPGSIQLTQEGPILLLNDCQTTGGYPRIGQVISTDLGMCGQKPPGSGIAFKMVDLIGANRIIEDHKKRLEILNLL